ncbi:hypothetical protein GCM10023189_44810 [Nibrella saemangeumensis]|uniref:Tetratricopeptide repeat-containing protein n=1 Tax=Nibrella saemangeumensis TaxID=1084526 RepID=A0ABP8NE91_9BACT
MKYTPAKLTRQQKKQQQAQELVHQADQAINLEETFAFMMKARELDPDNVEVLTFMGTYSPDLPARLAFFERAIVVGKERLGEEFDQLRGHFWSFHQTRPYMRAKAGLIQTLISHGQYNQAIPHLWDMLELNKLDNQGMRYFLSTALLEQRDVSGYQQLLNRFPEDRPAAWKYNHALFLFQTEGSSQASQTKLKEAIRRNGHVAAYLLGTQKLPLQAPEVVLLGHTSEAVAYAQQNRQLWHTTPGALAWLKRTAQP